jgi:YggT family protein
MTNPIAELILMCLNLYQWAIFIWVAMSIMVSYQILNPRQALVLRVLEVLTRIIEPALEKIRRMVNPLNGIDFSPLILWLAVHFVQSCVRYLF